MIVSVFHHYLQRWQYAQLTAFIALCCLVTRKVNKSLNISNPSAWQLRMTGCVRTA
jgi:hypothetical protein